MTPAERTAAWRKKNEEKYRRQYRRRNRQTSVWMRLKPLVVSLLLNVSNLLPDNDLGRRADAVLAELARAEEEVEAK